MGVWKCSCILPPHPSPIGELLVPSEECPTSNTNSWTQFSHARLTSSFQATGQSTQQPQFWGYPLSSAFLFQLWTPKLLVSLTAWLKSCTPGRRQKITTIREAASSSKRVLQSVCSSKLKVLNLELAIQRKVSLPCCMCWVEPVPDTSVWACVYVCSSGLCTLGISACFAAT